MKRLLSFIITLIILMASVHLTAFGECETDKTEPPPYDFKQFYWGASVEEITKIEGEPDNIVELSQNQTVLIYDTIAVNLDMELAYYICDEGLYCVIYHSKEIHSVYSKYIDDYDFCKKALTKKYGVPLFDMEEWSNNIKKQQYGNDRGTALLDGFLSYHTGYTTPTSHIMISLEADNNRT